MHIVQSGMGPKSMPYLDFLRGLLGLLVFLGIAWAVYAFFFKALGIFLMLVEITWFILKPIWSELSVWKKRWKQVSVGRRTRLWLVLLTSGVLLALPWRMDIVTTGVAHAERQHCGGHRLYLQMETVGQNVVPSGEIQ